MGNTHKNERTNVSPRGGISRSSEETSVIEAEPRADINQRCLMSQPTGNELNSHQKSFVIPKELIWNAYKRVRDNHGAHGVDKMSLRQLERNLPRHLYKLWNRMSSGSYHPSPVRLVEIPKKDGKLRPLGIPTVLDRVAQTAVKIILEEKLEKVFHPDSFGYRPGKSSHQAIAKTRQRSWNYDWVVDLDIQSFFDNLNHELLMKAVKVHSDSKWINLYIQRWLKAPLEKQDGTLKIRDKGTPQGGSISPLLANLFLHYAFDLWMVRKYPQCPFERYADDMVVHCKTQDQAYRMKEAIESRLRECCLTLHPVKTRIVYCKDSNRRDKHIHHSFDFQGYTFKPRGAINPRGQCFISFLPGVSRASLKHMREQIRVWKLHRRSSESLSELSENINPVVRGWVNYYGRYYRSSLYIIVNALDERIVKWTMRKLRMPRGAAWRRVKSIREQQPNLFAHWIFRQGQATG